MFSPGAVITMKNGPGTGEYLQQRMEWTFDPARLVATRALLPGFALGRLAWTSSSKRCATGATPSMERVYQVTRTIAREPS